MPEENIRRKRRLSSFQIIILGFAGVILLGALLLMLPISANGRNVTPFNETLFTATSAVCVTGLVVQDTGSYWSTFGQEAEEAHLSTCSENIVCTTFSNAEGYSTIRLL